MSVDFNRATGLLILELSIPIRMGILTVKTILASARMDWVRFRPYLSSGKSVI